MSEHLRVQNGNELSPVIYVDKEKCVNCHACVAACPVKYAIDASGDHVSVNHDLCIGCGKCIEACSHQARLPIDDTEAFFEALDSGKKISAIVAPAAAANFPGEYLRLNGWLKSIGIKKIFDVSLGAELTVKSYLEYIKTHSPDMVIAQPCPAIVSYIELYRPELLPYLAPADSPMLHAIKMIKKFFPECQDHVIAVISPCIAKRREFDETGFGDFNVTMSSLRKYIDEHSISLGSFPETIFDNPPAERAVLFSSPGGLLRTAERELPSIRNKTRKIEGQDIIYHYLDKLPEMLQKGFAPLLIDCLNCEMGCNGGPGTDNKDKSLDEVEYYIEERKRQMLKHYGNKEDHSSIRSKKRLHSVLDEYWSDGLYSRNYINRSDRSQIKIPTDPQKRDIYEKMHKFSDEDIYNCAACGYGSCEKMAEAIFNGLNKPENCHYYLQSVLAEEQKHVLEESEKYSQAAKEAENAHSQLEEQMGEIERSNEKMQKIYQDNIDVARVLARSIVDLESSNKSVSQTATDLYDLVKAQERSFSYIVESSRQSLSVIEQINPILTAVIDISEHTRLLSINASIEAARAGDYGKGFSVVASEVRNLSDASQKETEKIKPYSEELKNAFQKINDEIQELTDKVQEVLKFTEKVSQATESISKQTSNIKSESEKLSVQEGTLGEDLNQAEGD